MAYINTQPQQQAMMNPAMNLNLQLFNTFVNILRNLLQQNQNSIPRDASIALMETLNLNNPNPQAQALCYQNAQRFINDILAGLQRQGYGLNGQPIPNQAAVVVIGNWANLTLEKLVNTMALSSISNQGQINNGWGNTQNNGIISTGVVGNGSGNRSGLFNFDDGAIDVVPPQQQSVQQQQPAKGRFFDPNGEFSQPIQQQQPAAVTAPQVNTTNPAMQNVMFRKLEPVSMEFTKMSNDDFQKQLVLKNDALEVKSVEKSEVFGTDVLALDVRLKHPVDKREKALEDISRELSRTSRNSEYCVQLRYTHQRLLNTNSKNWIAFIEQLKEEIVANPTMTCWEFIEGVLESTPMGIAEIFTDILISSFNEVLANSFRYAEDIQSVVRIEEISDFASLYKGDCLPESLKGYSEWQPFLSKKFRDCLMRAVNATVISPDNVEEAIPYILRSDDLEYYKDGKTKFDILTMSEDDRKAMVSEILSKKTIVLVDRTILLTNMLSAEDIAAPFVFPDVNGTSSQQVFWMSVDKTNYPNNLDAAKDGLYVYSDTDLLNPNSFTGKRRFITDFIKDSQGKYGMGSAFTRFDGS